MQISKVSLNQLSLKAVIDFIPHGVLLVDKNGFILMSNSKASKILGKNEKEIISSKFDDLFNESEIKKIEIYINKSFTSSSSFTKVFEMNGNLETRYIEATSSVISADMNKEALMIAINDSTKKVLDEKRHEFIENMLIRSERKFHHIFNIAVSAILILNKHGNLIDVNPAASQLFNLTRGELIGKKLHDFLDEEDKLKSDNEFKEAIKINKRRKGEVKVKLEHGIIRETDYNFIPNFVKGNHLYILRDITDIKMEKKRQEYFLGILGHELKTPLAGIKAYAQITQRRIKVGDNRKLDYYLSRIDSQVDKLTKFVNEILDMTRIRAGKLNIVEEVFNFDEMLEETVESVREAFEGYALKMEMSANKNVIADRNRIGEVILNLISNAVKYSPISKEIIIKSNFTKNKIILSVKDFGLGISQEKKEKIFEPFFRATDIRDEKLPGLGLGLYISSEIIKLHEGKMWMESEPGKGSTFYFMIPVRRKKNNKK